MMCKLSFMSRLTQEHNARIERFAERYGTAYELLDPDGNTVGVVPPSQVITHWRSTTHALNELAATDEVRIAVTEALRPFNINVVGVRDGGVLDFGRVHAILVLTQDVT